MKIYVQGDPINCRDAMLELELSRIDFATILGMEVSAIVELCLTDGDLPEHTHEQVIDLLNRKRRILTKAPPRDRIHKLMEALAEEKRMLLEHATRRFALTKFQLDLVRSDTGWLHLGMAELPPFYGLRCVVCLTIAGYVELGLVTRDEPIGVSVPNGDGMTEATYRVYQQIQEVRAETYRQLETLEIYEKLLLRGSSHPSLIASQLNRAFGFEELPSTPELARLTHEKGN